jgi:Tfp pilus assembly protein PilF
MKSRLLRLTLARTSLSLLCGLMFTIQPVEIALELTGRLPNLSTGTRAQAATGMRVVVLPFQNLTGKSEDQWLGESFAESLTMGLLKVEALQVIERSQISQILREQQFGQTGLVDEGTAPRLGKLVGAEVVILGSYQKVGEQIQANVRFVHLETGQVDKKWATQVEGSLNQLFGLQKQLARELIAQMQIPTTATDVKKVDAVFDETKSTEAHRHYVEGLSKLRRGLNPKAIIRDFKAALNEDPNYALAYAGLAEVHAHLSAERKRLLVLPPNQSVGIQGPGDEALAQEYAQKALALNPELAQTWRALSWLEQNKGHFERALELSKKALLLNPRDSDSLSAYISIRMMQGNIRSEKLREELKSLGANMDDPWLKYAMAGMALIQETFQSKPNFKWIEDLLNEAALDLPDLAYIPLLQSTISIRLGDHKSARILLEKSVQLGSDSPDLLYTAASLYNSIEEPKTALNLVEQALKLDANHFAARTEKANILSSLNRESEAETLFGELEKERPESTMLQFSRGVYHLQTDKTKSLAQQYLSRALKLWERDPQGISRSLILSLLGMAYISDKRLPEARKVYEELRSDPIYYGQAYETLAGILAESEDYAGALESYTNFLKIMPEMVNEPQKKQLYSWYYLLRQKELEPDNSLILNDLAQLAMQFKNYTLARKFLTEGLAKNPENPTLIYNLGYLEMAETRLPEARSALQKAVKLKADYLKAWFNLALVYQSLGQMPEARSALMRVLELDGSHSEARGLLQKWANP